MNDINVRIERETVVTATVDNFSDLSLRLEGDKVETTTNRLFKICDTHIFSTLKELF